MSFIPPTWYVGLLTYGVMVLLPLIIGIILAGYAFISDKRDKKHVTCLAIGIIFIIIGGVMCIGGADFVWHETFEVPSVQEKVITIAGWQPRPGVNAGEINDASDLLLITTDGEAFENTETFWFQKFDTRDIFYQLRENGTYKIKYYGWREGFTNSFPNVLSVEQVVDENGTVPPSYNKYFGINLVGGGFSG